MPNKELHAVATKSAVKRVHIPQFQFRYWGGKLGICELRVYKKTDGTAIVIATDRCDVHHCASVTNASEFIHAAATVAYGLDPVNVRYIEHYPDGRPVLDEVKPSGGISGNSEPKFAGVTWRPIQRSVVEHLIGEKLEDSP